MTRNCRKCKIVKDLDSEFPKAGTYLKDGTARRRYWCRTCWSKYNSPRSYAYNKKHREQTRAHAAKFKRKLLRVHFYSPHLVETLQYRRHRLTYCAAENRTLTYKSSVKITDVTCEKCLLGYYGDYP